MSATPALEAGGNDAKLFLEVPFTSQVMVTRGNGFSHHVKARGRHRALELKEIGLERDDSEHLTLSIQHQRQESCCDSKLYVYTCKLLFFPGDIQYVSVTENKMKEVEAETGGAVEPAFTESATPISLGIDTPPTKLNSINIEISGISASLFSINGVGQGPLSLSNSTINRPGIQLQKIEESDSDPAGPEVTTPEVTTPEVTTPEVTTPEVTTPEGSTPEGSTPEGN
ncbi:hypothetical protein [Blastopirellula marina]|uniref:Uncharacterized protein n=1 Tax=Blastopirellula marina DSM 3645 TaxID=314230 RepID=A4A247_9BACT|nr:hypothetical protein [Blastopirellula marina]EAQ77150.1 hypothetical protein DSM3645_15140 [Blastopirellula marina DSM 3645]